MMFNADARRSCSSPSIATISLTGCATGVSEPRAVTICRPWWSTTAKFRARRPTSLMLPGGSAIAEMLSDYAVMRDQARACGPEMSR